MWKMFHKRKQSNKAYVHKKGTPFKCEICGNEFSNNDYLKKHMKLHADENVLKCPECPYASKVKDSVRQHHKRMHEKAK